MLRGAFAPLAGTVQRSLHSSFQDVVGKGTFPGLHYEIRGFTAGLRVLPSPEFVFALALSPLDAVSRYNLSCPPACPASRSKPLPRGCPAGNAAQTGTIWLCRHFASANEAFHQRPQATNRPGNYTKTEASGKVKLSHLQGNTKAISAMAWVHLACKTAEADTLPTSEPQQKFGEAGKDTAGFKGWMKDERCASRTASC